MFEEDNFDENDVVITKCLEVAELKKNVVMMK